MKKTIKKKTLKQVKKEPYKASVKLFGVNYESKGDTVSDAIANLNIRNSKGGGLLTIEKGEKSKARIVPAFIFHRIFNQSRVSKEINLKQLSSLFQI